MRMQTLNLFYEEPNYDRWLPLDRFPRALVRRLVHGPRRPGGQERVFLNLKAGLDRLGHPYRANDYRHARKNPHELCCVLGKRPVLHDHPWPNPLMVGPCTHDHPIDDPELLKRWNIRRILVPGDWMRRMCEPAWGPLVHTWPVGIDTDLWQPDPSSPKDIDFLVYYKIRWDHARRDSELVNPILHELTRRGLTSIKLRYGSYDPPQLVEAVRRSRAMLFLCEHETQGLAYQQVLSCDVPVLAWDHGGDWLDPSFHPHRVRYGPVSSVPYWDDRCGVRFQSAADFPGELDRFLATLSNHKFAPRRFIVDNLSLRKCSVSFIEHATAACSSITQYR